MENNNKYSYICMSLYVPENDKEYEALLRLLSCYPRRKTLFVKKLIDKFLKEHGITDISNYSDAQLKELIKDELYDRPPRKAVSSGNGNDELAQFLTMLMKNQASMTQQTNEVKKEPVQDIKKSTKPKRTNLFQKKSVQPVPDEGADIEEDNNKPVVPLVEQVSKQQPAQEEMTEEETDMDTSGLLDNWQDGLSFFS